MTEEGGVPAQIGDFHLLREAGRGGMGIVYEAVQQSLGRHIALKVLPPNAVLDPRYLHRFRREAQAVARLHHPNIAPVFGVAEEGGVHYYAMQFIRGRGLDQILQNARAGDGRATLRALLLTARDATPSGDADLYRRLAEIGRQAGEALDYAHGQGVLHRDVKPSNILIDADGHAWVTDFGLAKLAGEGEELTATGDLVGTLRYMAPERLQGQGDARPDVYSLGLTLYELATERPWSAPAPGHGEAIRQAMDGQAPRPRRLNPKLPRDLETIILKATAAEPSHRYATARELAEDLGRFIEDRPVLASRTSLPRRIAKWARRRPALAGLATLAAFALLAAFAGVTVALVQSERRADAERRALREQSAQRERIERASSTPAALRRPRPPGSRMTSPRSFASWTSAGPSRAARTCAAGSGTTCAGSAILTSSPAWSTASGCGASPSAPTAA